MSDVDGINAAWTDALPEPPVKMCDVCEMWPARWSNPMLLGSDAKLCYGCVTDWYELAITDPDELKKRRRAHIEGGKER